MLETIPYFPVFLNLYDDPYSTEFVRFKAFQDVDRQKGKV